MSKSSAMPDSVAGALLAAAMRHLERYSCSVEGLRRVLRRKLTRTRRRDGAEADDPADAAATEAVVTRLLAAGLIDDRRFAEGRVATLTRQGRSLRTIGAYLAACGVAADIVTDVLTPVIEEARAASSDPDLAAARALVKRRRLGPFRTAEQRLANRRRDLATLGRAGFSYDIARQVVDGDEP
jgi:regulatory protein